MSYVSELFDNFIAQGVKPTIIEKYNDAVFTMVLTSMITSGSVIFLFSLYSLFAQGLRGVWITIFSTLYGLGVGLTISLPITLLIVEAYKSVNLYLTNSVALAYGASQGY